jgi:hypothetical protein
MSATQIHLALNHLPLFGSAIAVVLLAWALWARSRDLTRAGLVLALVCGVGGVVAKQSGEGAEEQVEELPWADHDRIHEHEEAGEWAFYLLAAAGIAAAAALVRMRKAQDARIETMVVLVLITIAFAATAKTAWEGGKIRHEENRPGFVFPK